jgi:hypothetical protein
MPNISNLSQTNDNTDKQPTVPEYNTDKQTTVPEDNSDKQ